TPGFLGVQYVTLALSGVSLGGLGGISGAAAASVQEWSGQRPSSMAQNWIPDTGPPQTARQGGSVSPPRVSQSPDDARSPPAGSVSTRVTVSSGTSGANCQTWNVDWASPRGTVSSLGGDTTGRSAGSETPASRWSKTSKSSSGWSASRASAST